MLVVRYRGSPGVDRCVVKPFPQLSLSLGSEGQKQAKKTQHRPVWMEGSQALAALHVRRMTLVQGDAE